jgi:hypothetical protein
MNLDCSGSGMKVARRTGRRLRDDREFGEDAERLRPFAGGFRGDDFVDHRGASAATQVGRTGLCDLVSRAGAAAHGETDRAIGHGFAMANDHPGILEAVSESRSSRSAVNEHIILKMKFKVIFVGVGDRLE